MPWTVSTWRGALGSCSTFWRRLSTWVSIVIAVIAFMFLRSGFDREELMAQQEEQKRLLEEEKARRAGKTVGGGASKQKIQVQRKR